MLLALLRCYTSIFDGFIEQMAHMAMNAGLIFVSAMFAQTLLNMLIEQTPQIFELTYAGQY